MIRRVFAWQPELTAICDRDIFGTRTLGYLKTYGVETNDVSFYAQYTGGRCVGVLSAAFGHGALTASADTDYDEWRQFAALLGLQSLLCSKTAAQAMGLPTEDAGHILRYFGTERMPQTPYIDPSCAAFSYREVYDLLQSCGFSLGAYPAWLGDFALRVRKGAADVRCIRSETTVAAASILFGSEHAVYLGAVATRPDCRGRGYAGDLVLSFTRCGKRAEILCKPHRLSFYQPLGFQQNGEFVLCPSFK